MSNASQTDPVERALVLILKRERERQKISATKLAAAVGLSRTTITHLENDDARPTFWVLRQIAGGLDLDFGACVSEAMAADQKPKGRRK